MIKKSNSIAHKGKTHKGIIITEALKKRISNTLKEKYKNKEIKNAASKPLLLFINDIFVKRYDSIRQAVFETKISWNTIHNSIINNKNVKRKYLFRYEDGTDWHFN